MPLSTRRSFTRGTPRGLFGSIGLMAAHCPVFFAAISERRAWPSSTTPTVMFGFWRTIARTMTRLRGWRARKLIRSGLGHKSAPGQIIWSRSPRCMPSGRPYEVWRRSLLFNALPKLATACESR
jgi:hypothetical protein